jgi:hypothetical protein
VLHLPSLSPSLTVGRFSGSDTGTKPLPRGSLVNDWLKEYAPWIAAVIAPVLAWAATRKKTIVEADASLRTDLRETEKYLRQQLREVESDNKILRAENLELKSANLTLKAEFEDFRRDTAREIASLREQLQNAMVILSRGKVAREQLQEDVEALAARVKLGEEEQG